MLRIHQLSRSQGRTDSICISFSQVSIPPNHVNAVYSSSVPSILLVPCLTTRNPALIWLRKQSNCKEASCFLRIDNQSFAGSLALIKTTRDLTTSILIHAHIHRRDTISLSWFQKSPSSKTWWEIAPSASNQHSSTVLSSSNISLHTSLSKTKPNVCIPTLGLNHQLKVQVLSPKAG